MGEFNFVHCLETYLKKLMKLGHEGIPQGPFLPRVPWNYPHRVHFGSIWDSMSVQEAYFFRLEVEWALNSCRNGMIILFLVEVNDHSIPFLVEWSKGLLPTRDVYLSLMKCHLILTLQKYATHFRPTPHFWAQRKLVPLKDFFSVLLYIHHYYCDFY